MQLLVAVINDLDRLDEILRAFYDVGIAGATVLHSEGMGRVLSQDVPNFAGLQELVANSRPQNRTLFSVIEDPELAERAMAILQDVCGRFSDPATGIAFIVPVEQAIGLASDLSRDGPYPAG